MRLVIVIALTLLLSFCLINRIEAQTLTNCELKDIGLFDNTLPLKIDSCYTLRRVLEDRLEDSKYDEESVTLYVKQYIENCMKPVEYEIINPKPVEVTNP